MRYHSGKNSAFFSVRARAFSLTEAVAALAILALVSSSILTVMNRCMASAANMTARMHAFEIARENMEQLLSQSKVQEAVDFGVSERYPEINWNTTVGTFSDSLTSRTWVHAICSATYIDTEGEEKTIELTHWLGDLSKKQLTELEERKAKEKELAAEEGLEEPEGPEGPEGPEPEEPVLPKELEGKTFDEIWKWLMEHPEYKF